MGPILKNNSKIQQALASAAISGATLIDTEFLWYEAGDGVHLSVSGQLDF